MRGSNPAPPLTVSNNQIEVLERLKRQSGNPRRLDIRIRIILKGSKGVANKVVARELNISLSTVKSWRNNWIQSQEEFEQIELGRSGMSNQNRALRKAFIDFFKDSPRKGRPARISIESKNLLIALACDKPEDHGIPVSRWTHELLAQVAISKGIVSTISPRHVGSILKKTN